MQEADRAPVDFSAIDESLSKLPFLEVRRSPNSTCFADTLRAAIREPNEVVLVRIAVANTLLNVLGYYVLVITNRRVVRPWLKGLSRKQKSQKTKPLRRFKYIFGAGIGRIDDLLDKIPVFGWAISFIIKPLTDLIEEKCRVDSTQASVGMALASDVQTLTTPHKSSIWWGYKSISMARSYDRGLGVETCRVPFGILTGFKRDVVRVIPSNRVKAHLARYMGGADYLLPSAELMPLIVKLFLGVTEVFPNWTLKNEAASVALVHQGPTAGRQHPLLTTIQFLVCGAVVILGVLVVIGSVATDSLLSGVQGAVLIVVGLVLASRRTLRESMIAILLIAILGILAALGEQ